MMFVLITTLVALIQLSRSNWMNSSGMDILLLNSVMSMGLIALSIYLVGVSLLEMLKTKKKAFQVQGSTL